MKLFRVKTNGQELQSGYGEVADNWEKTETENEYRVQVTNEIGFEDLADEDPAVMSYWEL